MGGTELKTDSFQRWVMYSKDAYASGRIFLSTEQKQAVEEGKKFSQRAYADIWAKDAALVGRVRAFLGTNFYWHERLAKNGADLEVIETLQSMIRGESVVLIAEQSRTGGLGGNPPPAPQGLPSFRSSLMNDCGMSYDAATAYIDRYNDMVDRINAGPARNANAAPSSLADAASDLTETAAPLGDAQPFDYQPDILDGDEEEVAARGVRMTGNEPGGFAINPNGQDVDYFDSDGNLSAQYHGSHGDPHGHNFSDGVRDNSHLPMSPINFD
ncbi:hypothetical protein SCB29_15410 [Paraburkholderia sp. SIMBA_055]|jgi:hypothetical protein|uniref:hypothetical protein n=1 Tax=Paraburkholderia sp. RL17-368-BIF-A TaxID=3031628 RepID=UPI0006B3EF7E